MLEEIKERLSKISPLPWFYRKQRTASESADIFIQGCNVSIPSGNWYGADYSQENADFITHAPTDIRALLDMVEERDRKLRWHRTELRNLKELIKELQED